MTLGRSRTVGAVLAAAVALIIGGVAIASAGNDDAGSLTTPGRADAAATRVAITATTTSNPPVASAPTTGGTLMFPMNPLPKCTVLDNFGDSRSGGRVHQGTDILGSLGQEVYAVADGKLVEQVLDGADQSDLSGNSWDLLATDNTKYVFMHLSGFAPGLSVGSTVTKGQVIGYVGDTGNPGAGNYHLHFEVHPSNRAAVDPYPLLAIPASCTKY